MTTTQPQATQPVSKVVEQQESPLPSASPSLPWWIILIAVGVAFIGGILVAVLILKRHQGDNLHTKKKKPLPDLYPF